MTVSVIPRPQTIRETSDVFTLTERTTIHSRPKLEGIAQRLAANLRPATGLPFDVHVPPSQAAADAITLSLDAQLPPSGYRLLVDHDAISIIGGDPGGVFHGTQTFLQLCPPTIFRRAPLTGIDWIVPGAEITDQPRFGWRGLLLDTSRHFFGRQHVLDLLDLLALHRFNVLHLHLTDDQGWRMQIRTHPRLTDIGAWRPRSAIGDTAELPPGVEPTYDQTPHAGYFTHDDLREIVAYATDRFITVVPEIDLPGHCQAALAAYPQLGNTTDPVQVWTHWGISPHVLNVSDDTLTFCRDVLAEVLEIFPSPFIHIGGDECPKDEWRQSAAAQQRIRELGLHSEDELQSWFIQQLATYLTQHGRRLIGWDEILDGGLPLGATVMSWRSEQGGIAAATMGHDVVMTPESHTYLYRVQSDDPRREPPGARPPLDLRTVYDYEPIPAGLGAAAAHHVLGAQCQMWTEFVTTPRQMQRMLFPRLCAFAETIWCAHRDSFDNFTTRLTTHLDRLHALDVDYFPHPSCPQSL